MGINEKPIRVLTLEDYNKYKSDNRFLHNVCFAHRVQGWENYNKALCFYSSAKNDFKVSEDLQKIAKEDYKKAKENIIKNIKVNDLVFVGMGMDFKPLNKEYIGNHRIRTYFKDNEGVLCFVEFGANRNTDFLRCDHALKNTKKCILGDQWSSLKEQDENEKRVYVLERLKGDNIKYTKENILKLVNENFNTNFKEVRVYNYFLNTSDYTSKSKQD